MLKGKTMISLISDEEASEKVKDVYDDIRSRLGMVPNFFRAQAAKDPEMLESSWQQWKNIMGQPNSLDRKTKELIAVAVSLTNHCHYCTTAHAAMASMSGASQEDLDETRQVVDLFVHFNKIADALNIPCDVMPDAKK